MDLMLPLPISFTESELFLIDFYAIYCWNNLRGEVVTPIWFQGQSPKSFFSAPIVTDQTPTLPLWCFAWNILLLITIGYAWCIAKANSLVLININSIVDLIKSCFCFILQTQEIPITHYYFPWAGFFSWLYFYLSANRSIYFTWAR